MRKRTYKFLLALLITAVGTGCASFKKGQDQSSTYTIIRVDGSSVGHAVLHSIPLESVMERLEMIDSEGRLVSYVSFVDSNYGGLVFLKNKLAGTISQRDARAFYSCRGYITATKGYWASNASEWIDSLIGEITPATSVELKFPIKTTAERIKEASTNPLLSTVKSLIGMGTNPLSIFRTFNATRSTEQQHESYEKTLQALNNIVPGDSETKLAEIVRPEDMSFAGKGIVMAYPTFLQDFYVNEGVIKVQQQPSFQRLSRLHAAVFYVRNMRWDQCSPSSWRNAIPADWKPRLPTENEGSGIFDEIGD